MSSATPTLTAEIFVCAPTEKGMIGSGETEPGGNNPKGIAVSRDLQEGVEFPDIPDGGLQAWLTVLGAFIIVFCSSGYVVSYLNSFGVYQDFYVREYLTEHSTSQISWIGGVQTFFLFSVGIFSGYAMDVGYFRSVTVAGSLLLIVCLFMISISKPQQWYQLFLAQGVGLGIAFGLIYVPSLGIIAHHFKRRRSLVMGVVASGSSIGGVIHPIMLNSLIHGRIGFHWGVRISAFFNLGLLLIANSVMTTRLPGQSKSLSEQIAYWRHFFEDRTYVIAVAGSFLFITGVFFPTFYLQLDVVEHGVDQGLALYMIAILNGSSAFGRVMPTIIADRVGSFKLIVPCILAGSALIFAMEAITNAAGAVVVGVLYGFFSGACISLMAPLVANLSRNVAEVGARIGVCYGIGGIGSLIGPPIAGALLTSRLIWIRPIVFSGTCMCAGAIVIAAAGILSAKDERAKQKVSGDLEL